MGFVYLPRDIAKAYIEAFLALAGLVEAKEPASLGHSHRVLLLCRQLARSFPLNHRQKRNLEWLAVLHEIGKVGIPAQILNKPGHLTPEEWEIYQKFPCFTAEILRATKDPRIQEIALLVEPLKVPYRVLREDLPLETRILAVADAYDELVSGRTYLVACSPTQALEIIEEDKGYQFDPKVVKALKKLLLRKQQGQQRSWRFFSWILRWGRPAGSPY